MGRFHRQAKIVFQAIECSGTEGGSGDGAGGCGGAWHEGRGWGLGGGSVRRVVVIRGLQQGEQ